MTELAVSLNSDAVGILSVDKFDKLHFQYNQQWLDNPDAVPLSKVLPIDSCVYSGRSVYAFFSGLLPEEGPREAVAKILGVSVGNDFAMLEKLGGECAGSITLSPLKNNIAHQCKESQAGKPVSLSELKEIVSGLPSKPLMTGVQGVRLSLAGAQDKLPVIVTDGHIYLPLGNSPSTHILKPEPSRFKGLATNEFFCMRLAQKIHLDVAPVEFLNIEGTPSLLIKRYDRVLLENRVVRLHQEDFCQALGILPTRKYQEEGGPGVSESLALIRCWSSVPVIEVRRFLDNLIFNVIIGNTDAHGKNYSFIYDGPKKVVSPLYDVVCTLAWPQLSKNLSMKIGSNRNAQQIEMAHWQQVAKRNNLGWPMVKKRLIEIRNLILKHLNFELLESGLDIEMVDKMKRVIARRCEILR